MNAVLRQVKRGAWVGLALILVGGLEPRALRAADHQKAVAFYRQGNGLLDQDRFSEAEAAYEQAIEQDPQYAQAYHNRALAEEMVDRQKAVQDWQRFVEVAGSQPDLKYDVARAEARLQILKAMPVLPESMRPDRYVSAAGDYYWSVSSESEGEEWRHLPVKVFLGSAPEMKWQEGTREAFDIWSSVFPLQLVAIPQEADIRMGWEDSVLERQHAGETYEWVQIRKVGNELTGRHVAVIVLDLRHPWSKNEMRAIVLHEMGHALGLKGHSDNRKDIMYMQMQEKQFRIPLPGGMPSPFFWRSLPKQPSQRDVNTLIRIYNSPGSSKRFP